jgi:hypothetical protein
MNNRFLIAFFGIVYVGVWVLSMSILARGIGPFEVMRVAALQFPFLFAVVVAARRYWLPFVLVFWTINITVTLMLLDSFSLGFILVMAVGVVYVLERLVRHEGLFRIDGFLSGILLVAGMIIIARLIVDRPGSARLGAGGGLRHAVSYSAAVPMFFLTYQLSREAFDTRRVLRNVFVILVLMVIWHIMRRVAWGDRSPLYFGWYEGSVWFLGPLVLAWLLQCAKDGRMALPVAWIFSLFIVVLSVLSPFRSRIYFALASIATVFWCYGYRRRLVIATVILCGLAIPALTVLPRSVVPVVARRALSTLLPFDGGDVRALHERGIDASGEVGWASEFRRAISEMAIRSIRSKPLLGQGWSFSTEELVWATAFQNQQASASALITAGDYHNSLLTVAVKCGLPAAVLLGIALFGLLWHNGMRLYEGSDPYFHILHTGLFGAVVAIFGQMLMNGGGQDLQAICALLGFFEGTKERYCGKTVSGEETLDAPA